MSNKPTPTSAQLAAMLTGDLENLIVASTPGGIEAQERRGQREFVASETLPRRILMVPDGMDTKAVYERLGCVVTGEANDLFLSVLLPNGWQKKPTDHSMWSHLVDNQSRVRGKIFYKAAFYDQRAHFTLEQRFQPGYEPISGRENHTGDESQWVGIVTDNDNKIWQTEPVNHDEKYSFEQVVRDWLDEHYPNWRDPFAYWDEGSENNV